MFLVGSSACVVESIGPLNITTPVRHGADLAAVRAARLGRLSRRGRLELPSPTALVQQVPRPTPASPEHRSALHRTPGVSTSSVALAASLRGFVHRFPAPCKPIHGESSIWRSARGCRFFPPSEISIDRGANQRNTHSRGRRVAALHVVFYVLRGGQLSGQIRRCLPFRRDESMAVHIAALVV